MSEAADALTPYSRRHLSVLQAGVTVLVIGALLALGAVSVKLNNQMRDTRARWASFDDAYTRHGQQWEALRGALGDKGAGLVNLHEGRRAREDMGYDRYHMLGYFELGMQAIHDILVQKGVVTEQEVQDRIEALKRTRETG